MAARGEVTLRELVCQRSECQSVFFICSRCYRGQCYCSLTCRRQARLQHHRCANRRYRNSPAARQDHRQRQQAYRRRHSQTMPDHTSILSALTSSSDCEPALTAAIEDPSVEKRVPTVCCRICGRTGRLLEHEAVRAAQKAWRMKWLNQSITDSC
jgi:hypothetical protein